MPEADAVHRITSPAPVFATVEGDDTPLTTLPAGHVIRVTSASDNWVAIEARSGAREVAGFVDIRLTTFGGI